MAVITKQFSFNSSAEGWTSSGTATYTRDTTEDATNDSNAGTGVLQSRTTGRRVTGTGYWSWAGTFEALGVPIGSTVTGINVSYDYRCSEYTTGATSSTGLMGRYTAGALTATYSNASSFSGTTTWATISGTAETGLSLPSSTSTEFRLNSSVVTGNSTTAAVTLRQDWIQVQITYTPPAAFTPIVAVF